MTHDTQTPLSNPTEGAPAPAGATGTSTPKWLPILTSVLCMGLMVVVLVLITAEREEETPPGAQTSSTGPRFGERDPADILGAPRPGGEEHRALAGCGETDPTKPPRLELVLEGGVVDFGSLKQGVKLVKEVTYRSAGTSPLCVVSAKSSCGCLKASLDGVKRVFAPGETGTIRLAVDTTGRMGEINKRVTITCNDPKSPLVSFRVKMDINAGLMSDPRYLQFGNVPPETSSSRVVYLRTEKDATDWKVTGVRSMRQIAGMTPPKYTFEVEELNDPKYRRVKVRITHPGLAQLGSHHDKLVIETTHPDRPEVRINSHMHVVARIVFRARTISLGFVRPGAPRAPTRARIQAGAPGISFAITGVEVVPAEGTSFGAAGAPFGATHGKDAKGWWVDVDYDGKSRKAGLVKAILLVKTDDLAQPELRIPIRATIQQAR